MGSMGGGVGTGGRVTRPKQPSGPSNFSNRSPTPAAQLPNTNQETCSTPQRCRSISPVNRPVAHVLFIIILYFCVLQEKDLI